MMKKIITLSCLLACFLYGHAQNPNDIIHIPDPILKDFLVNHYYTTEQSGVQTIHYLDANRDGEIQYSEAENYTSWPIQRGFNMNSLGISDLTGIEAFKSIEYLDLNYNNLNIVDLSGCVSLTEIRIDFNPVESFELHSPVLEKINLGNNENLTSVDLSGCGGLIEINISNNDMLEHIDIRNSHITERLAINYNPLLNNIEMANFYELNLFQCYSNGITSLDISSCSVLQYFFCAGNPNLSELNMANGNPQSFIQINASQNPNLTCIQVDNAYVANFLWNDVGGYYVFDEWAEFSEDCSPPGPCIVDIPDANLKAFLLADPNINSDGNDEIDCDEAEAYTGEINLDNIEIVDFTGLEAFVNITGFKAIRVQRFAGQNPPYASSLDLNGFTSLTDVTINSNVGLEEINLSHCTALTNVDVSTPRSEGIALNLTGCESLTELNLSQKKLNSLILDGCSGLTELNCSKNLLTELDISDSSDLTNLNFSENAITELNINNNRQLTHINGSKNELDFLFTALNSNLEDLNLSYNELTYLDVGNNINLTILNCSHNELNSVVVNNNHQLENLNCSYNNLTQLYLDNNISLKTINAEHNQLNALNINQLVNLESLISSYNNLPEIDLSDNLSLKNLTSAGNNISTIDISQNVDLRTLDLSHNQLTSIDISENTALIAIVLQNNNLIHLDLSNHSILSILDISQNDLIELDLGQSRMVYLLCQDNNLNWLNLANGYNTDFFYIEADNNPNLTCIQVDDADYSNTNWTNNPSFIFDVGVAFNEICDRTANYIYQNNSWTPEHPNLSATQDDNIIVINGTANELDAINDELDINNITIMANATLEINSILNLHGNLSVNGDLIFGSGEDFDGELGFVAPSSIFSGEVTIHRYMSENRAYRMVSSPVTTTNYIRDNWQEGVNNPDPDTNYNPNEGFGTHITGEDPNLGFDVTQTGNPSLFTVDLTNQMFVAVPNTNTTRLNSGDAFLLFVRGDRDIDLNDNSSFATTTLRTTGTLYRGDKTEVYSVSSGDFIMFGNPYQSVLDAKAVLEASTNVNDNHYYVYDPTLGTRGAYVTVDFILGVDQSSEANQFLQPGQAAQLITTGESVLLNIKEEHKTPGEHTATHRGTMPDNLLSVQLYITENYSEGRKAHDSFRMVFDDNFSNEITLQDALMPYNFYENIGINNDGTYLSIERRQMPQQDEIFQIYTTGYNYLDYTFKLTITGLENTSLYLKDQFTGDILLLDQEENIFHFAVDPDNPMSISEDRFIIQAERTMGIHDLSMADFSLYPNPASTREFYIQAPTLNGENVEINIMDMSGKIIYSEILNVISNKITISTENEIASGVYLIRLKHQGENLIFKLIKE